MHLCNSYLKPKESLAKLFKENLFPLRKKETDWEDSSRNMNIIHSPTHLSSRNFGQRSAIVPN